MINANTIAVICGDRRQIFAAKRLVEYGFNVLCYGTDGIIDDSRIVLVKTLEDAISNAKILLCPMPFSRDGKNLVSSNRNAECTIGALLNSLRRGQILVAGNIPADIEEFCKKQDVTYVNIAERNDFALLNAVATAEGTILEAINASSVNLHKSRSLVLGYGRCAKVLAHKLSALNSNVTVCVRSSEAAASAEADGHNTMDFASLENNIGRFDFIFNTVPAQVISKESVAKISKDATVIDIASAPGGVDFDAAKLYGVNALLCLGLPGKYAPKTSGEIIANIIHKIAQERGIIQ